MSTYGLPDEPFELNFRNESFVRDCLTLSLVIEHAQELNFEISYEDLREYLIVLLALMLQRHSKKFIRRTHLKAEYIRYLVPFLIKQLHSMLEKNNKYDRTYYDDIEVADKRWWCITSNERK